MRIFYAVQATGNGHISRAMELLPHLQQYGEVDIFLSGQNSSLQLDAPVAYRSKGLSLFYTEKGGLHYGRIARHLNPVRLYKEIHELPVEQYDFVINDFEFITAQACRLKKVPSVNFGHQASFLSPHTPRPSKRDFVGELILKHYGRASRYIGLHFRPYDDFILTPVIRKQIADAYAIDKGHVTVYLPAHSEGVLEQALAPLKDIPFQVFSAGRKVERQKDHITFKPVDKQQFAESLITCHGIITGAGFETPAEALHLGKKLMVIPIRGQYEQLCNAAAIEDLGGSVVHQISRDFGYRFYHWLNQSAPAHYETRYSTEAIVARVMNTVPDAAGMETEAPRFFPELQIG